jgi:photosystem II stability/assembly factor-like uncharacterized protein
MPPIKTRWRRAGIGVILTVAAVGWWVVGRAILWPQAPVAGATAGEGQGPGASAAHVHALTLDHVRNILFFGTHHGLSRSQDEGKTWSKVEITGEVPSTDFMALAIDPTNPQTFYAAGPNLGVVKSTDGGTTWTRMSRQSGVTPVSTRTGDSWLFARVGQEQV